MRDLVNWQDHIVEFPGRFIEENLGNGMVQHTPAPGEIRKQGTPQNATNFNTMDLAALEAMLMASESIRQLRMVQNSLDGIEGTIIEVTLTNSQPYPHNNSKKAVQLPSTRNAKNYVVDCELVSAEDGPVGDFEISDKLLNGFKIAYTGSAKKVVVNCHIRGGI